MRLEHAFDLIPMLYSRLLPDLLELQLIKLHNLTILEKFPSDHDANACCEFHNGVSEHSIEICKELKCQVHDLLNTGKFVFTPDGLNVQVNPFVAKKVVTPSHA